MKKETCVKLYKTGKFYHSYGDDGRVVHELLGYKYVEFKQSVGFPENALVKVKAALEKEKISYKVFEKDTETFSFSGINKKYNEVLENAYKNATIESRIDHLHKIIDSCSEEELEKILDFIENEKWK